MRYKLQKNPPVISLTVEASFTLLDFMALFACLLLGVFFALFLWIFAFAILVKVFTRYDFEFSSDTYKMTQYLRIFSYLRIKRRTLPFDEIDKFLFSNFDSGQALGGRGLINKEWFTLDIVTKDRHRIQLAKAQTDELEEMDELYFELKDYLIDWFSFEVEYEEIK
tara:strand:+ start:15282 stop:15779 length:498 start_codon:yes stop_codon:yes gene_type:complete